MTARRVLICEDEGLTVMALRKALVRAGYVVVGEERSGEEAILAAKQLQPDLILMDIRLHGPASGIDAMREILKTRSVPIVIVSAYNDEETVHTALYAGASGYLVKPLTSDQLLLMIERALARFETLNTAAEALAAAPRYLKPVSAQIGCVL